MTLTQKIEAAAAEVKGLIASGVKDLDALQKRVEEISAAQKQAAKPPARLVNLLKEDKYLEEFMRGSGGHVLIDVKDGDVDIFRKTAVTESGVGFSVPGVIPTGRLAGITSEPRQVLMLEDVLASDVTTEGVVQFSKATSVAPGAVAQTEGADLGENAAAFTSAAERIQTVGCWIPMSRQIVEDYGELASFIRNTLAFYTDLAVELQLLSGSGVDPDLHGLITQATLADQTLLSASGWNMLDSINAAIEQIAIAKEIPPTFVVVNPVDWAKARRLKSTTGGSYLYGEPSEDASTLWGLTVCPTSSISSGHFLVGSSSAAAAQVINQQQITVELARNHASYFTANKIAIRADRRLTLVVRRPSSFVYGNFVSSPAS